MNFTLTITASNELLEAIQLLTGMMGTRSNPPKELPIAPASQTVAPTRTRKNTASASVEAKEEVKEEIAEQVTSDEPVTIEAVRAAVQVKAQSGKRDEVKTLLTTFEVTRVTDLPEDKYSSFLKKVEAL